MLSRTPEEAMRQTMEEWKDFHNSECKRLGLGFRPPFLGTSLRSATSAAMTTGRGLSQTHRVSSPR
jgi:hypothetical protein